MLRRLFNWLTLVSLLLGIAVAGLWVRSVWWTGDAVNLGSANGVFVHDVWILSDGGIISVSNDFSFTWRTELPPGQNWVALEREHTRWSQVIHGIAIPKVFKFSIADWLLIILCLPLPFWWAVQRHRNRRPPGQCLKCGYDLRASKDQCPECGAPTLANTPSVTAK